MNSLPENASFDQLVDEMIESGDVTVDELPDKLKDLLKGFLKDRLESMMEGEREAFLEEDAGEDNRGNGFYDRSFRTRFGKIENLNIPRDREGNFQTELFEPYQKQEDWLEKMIIGLYTRGVSTREIADLLEKMYGDKYSSSVISRITDITLEEVEDWQNREIDDEYYVLYIDGFVVDLRRDSVGKEAIYLVSGVNRDGYREILGFYVGGNESATVWKEVLSDLKERGLEKVLLVVSDDLAGLQETVKEVFPKADVQPCMAHKVRNAVKKVRAEDQEEVADALKKIYNAQDRQGARKYLRKFEEKWSDKYPRITEKWREEFDRMTTFMSYPDDIWEVIYTTNWLERTIKEFRKRLKPMNSIPTIQAAEKIVYLKSALANRRWSERKLRGFKSAKLELDKMFEERYPS